MKAAVLLVSVAVSVLVSAEDEAAIKNRLAHIDIDKILSNERVLKSYVNCFLDQGPCTPEGREAKKQLPEVYRTNCAKCSDDEKTYLKKSVKAVIAKRKTEWDQVVDKYDPTHKYEADFIKWIQEP